MEYSLTASAGNRQTTLFVLILILMEYSLTICKRVIYVFHSSFYNAWNSLFSQRVSSISEIFSQMYAIPSFIPNKKAMFFI